MSWVALATARYEEACAFYGKKLGRRVVDAWDRPSGRATVFDMGGLRLEVLDARREREIALGDPKDRLHLVLEVEDVDAFRRERLGEAPEPHDTSWGARLLRLRDPDGIPVTVLSWRPLGSRPPTPTA